MLISRNVTIGSLRTSMRLEPEFWSALTEIARAEDLTIDELCTRVDARRGKLSRSGAVRMFATAYLDSRRQDATTASSAIDTRSLDIKSPAVPVRIQA